jgi:hypothetical protein
MWTSMAFVHQPLDKEKIVKRKTDLGASNQKMTWILCLASDSI